MTYRTIPPAPPPTKHHCPLPTEKYKTGYPEGTLIQCDICLRWWVCVEAWRDDYVATKWRKVRWFDFDYRKRIPESKSRELPHE